MGREVVNIRSSDIVIIMGGHSGTLGEFSIAYDEGNLIGVLLGTGGIALEIRNIVKIIQKKTGAKVMYESDPRVLLDNLLDYNFLYISMSLSHRRGSSLVKLLSLIKKSIPSIV